MSYITTYSKKHLDPTNADINDIDILDIAHALSLMCRANGHFKHFYSVAQHSLNCLKEAKARGYSKRVQLGCLLHDASEAYLSDITRPVKVLLSEYFVIEEKLQEKIFNKWLENPLSDEERKLVFEIDDAVLYYEFINLMGEELTNYKTEISARLEYDFCDFKEVEKSFINELNALINA